MTNQEMPRHWSKNQRRRRSMSISGCVPSGRNTTLPTIWHWQCSQKVRNKSINYTSRASLLMDWQKCNWFLKFHTANEMSVWKEKNNLWIKGQWKQSLVAALIWIHFICIQPSVVNCSWFNSKYNVWYKIFNKFFFFRVSQKILKS